MDAEELQEPIKVPIELVTRAQAKCFKQELNNLIKKVQGGRDQQRRTNQISPCHQSQSQNLNPHGRLLGWHKMLQAWFNEFSLLFKIQ